ncbi:nuclear transport factor 2 family protein [Phenylobacterium sp. J426]|uniref:nuclear transport factor 2 family protein n=1 Tax=Phenylobacterium sp. J426 TaxID=2898439 RepID=UPI002151A05C|nr:nuclear transport factor 2 family protein [Phenylobacterium sp. J426]MCR5872728.1 nuclear transport factor 2 family protein [Phenylobacterium sp. J426]MCR5876479.1 nuclear transport factor 2 family protein [Phenylobacterium sp. J426]
MDEAAIRAFAKRFFDAIEQGDVDTVRDSYTPDVEIWHNFDDLIQTREENVETLKGMVGRISDRVYDNRRLEVFADGFVQQHVLRGTRKDGKRVSLPAALIVKLRDGKIARLDEYIDSAHVAVFRQTF